ncbi:hypothetical protein I5G21_03075 [Pseudomonas aeruginosa]|nr:hypothetical protein [Pseudomonas aeruginosa]
MSAETPRERPILFNDQMVRAILEGRKTVTRRVVKPQPDFLGSMVDPSTPFKTLDAGLHARITCPYGEPGDRLWVREAWTIDLLAAYSTEKGYDSEYELRYRTDDASREIHVAPGEPDPYLALYDSLRGDWRPSIHMPRWASRILLEITAVRVERLQDITPNQCIAEGAWREKDKELGRGQEAIAAFADLWRSTGGDWDANPWVWVVEFRRVTP